MPNGSSPSFFTRFAKATSAWAGRPISFLLAVLIIVVWGVTGPIFHYSDTWQLVINTGTTIVTFLMVFLIQNTQNRDSMAVQLKLDELINSIKDARNELINVESLDEKELEEKREEMVQLAEEAQNAAEEVKDTAKSAAEGLVDHAKTAAEQLVETAEEVKKIPKG